MKSVVTSILFVLAVASSQVLAAPQNRGPPGRGQRPSSSGRPSETCGTVYGPRRTLVGRGTTTSTITTKSTTTIFKTSLFTTTPAQLTTSLTDTVYSTVTTTLSTPTDTIYTTTTQSTTSLITQTSIQTTTSVITTTTSLDSTTTSSLLPGFTPIESSITELPPPPPPRKRQSRPQGGSAGQFGDNVFESDGESVHMQNNNGPSSPGHPQSVKCTVITTKTITVSKTSTILSTITAPAPTITITGTTTSVSTSTFNPEPASSTITESTTTTFSSTISTTQTQTEFTTTTSTSYTSTTTAYPACATNNMLDSFNGFTIATLQVFAENYPIEQTLYENDFPTALECCIFALSDPLTWTYAFITFEDLDGELLRFCFIVKGEYCPVPTTPVIVAPGESATAQATVGYASAATSGYTVGNGACGVVAYATNVSPPP